MFGGRAGLPANQLKRAQAINCAEAALYETFNRIRAAGLHPASNFTDTVDVKVADPENPSATYNITVNIAYTVGTPNKVSATVDYDPIRM